MQYYIIYVDRNHYASNPGITQKNDLIFLPIMNLRDTFRFSYCSSYYSCKFQNTAKAIMPVNGRIPIIHRLLLNHNCLLCNYL